MNKLKLEDLTVESFETTESDEGGGLGTVVGHHTAGDTVCAWTCDYTCKDTCRKSYCGPGDSLCIGVTMCGFPEGGSYCAWPNPTYNQTCEGDLTCGKACEPIL